MTELEPVADKCQLQLRPLDKKREKYVPNIVCLFVFFFESLIVVFILHRQLLFTHRQAFMDQLTTETNPATAFHLVVVLLYLKKNNAVVHAPGRSVATILAKLKPDLPPATFNLLSELQGKVVKYLTDKQNNPAGVSEVETELTARLAELKALVLNPSASDNNNESLSASKDSADVEAPAPRGRKGKEREGKARDRDSKERE